MPCLASLPQELLLAPEWQCCWGGEKQHEVEELSDSLSGLEVGFQHIAGLFILLLLFSFLSRNF